MSILDKLRAHIDAVNKRAAELPEMPTGGDNRTLSEAIETGAAARGLAAMSTKKAQVAVRPMPLRDLVKVRKPG